VPHSGRDYPDWLIALAGGGKAALSTLEDPLVDRLIWRALQRGCGAVVARAPRAAIDCNRAEDEVDPSVIDGLRRGRVSARARGGLGIACAHAVADAVEHGVRVTGVTVHLVDDGHVAADSGPIVLQEALEVSYDDRAEDVTERLHEIEHRLLPRAVRLFSAGGIEVLGRRVRVKDEHLA
jgi:hypothetical protein